jgi:IS1 family transposase
VKGRGARRSVVANEPNTTFCRTFWGRLSQPALIYLRGFEMTDFVLTAVNVAVILPFVYWF